ncbi:Secreted protein containing DUF1552 [Planctomycetales bacterium 10988]|nr:Secreted protein containing DUF1552 [Planctomycetales bacterium 10988]
MIRTSIPRRTFLKGIGVSLGLPYLEAMAPLAQAKTIATPPTRMAFVFFPNGAIMPNWRPEGEGKNFKFGKTMESLESLRDDITLITGLAHDKARSNGDGAGDHARCASSFLTGAQPVKTSGANIKVGISVDQVAAEQVGLATKLPSLEIGVERGRSAGSCDSGYSCAYSSNISWKTPSTPMAKEIVPRLAFERLFGSRQESKSSAQRRDFYRKSILDLVAEDAIELKQQLGSTDRRKVDEYFQSVRDLERQIHYSEEAGRDLGAVVDFPTENPGDRRTHIRLMYDLMTLAFQTDSTRIATFMLANAGSQGTYPMVEVNDGHHQLSHHRNDEEKVAKLSRIDRFLIDEFARFLEKMKSIPEGEGSLLDHSMIVYGSAISDGNRHRHEDLPIIMAGRGGNTIQSGRHINLHREIPMNNLFLSLLDRVGAKVESIGDSSGRLTALDV